MWWAREHSEQQRLQKIYEQRLVDEQRQKFETAKMELISIHRSKQNNIQSLRLQALQQETIRNPSAKAQLEAEFANPNSRLNQLIMRDDQLFAQFLQEQDQRNGQTMNKITINTSARTLLMSQHDAINLPIKQKFDSEQAARNAEMIALSTPPPSPMPSPAPRPAPSPMPSPATRAAPAPSRTPAPAPRPAPAPSRMPAPAPRPAPAPSRMPAPAPRASLRLRECQRPHQDPLLHHRRCHHPHQELLLRLRECQHPHLYLRRCLPVHRKPLRRPRRRQKRNSIGWTVPQTRTSTANLWQPTKI
jgi:hypothetical protein